MTDIDEDDPKYDEKQKELSILLTRELICDWNARPSKVPPYCACRLLGKRHRGLTFDNDPCVPPFLDHPVLLLNRDSRKPKCLIYNPYPGRCSFEELEEAHYQMVWAAGPTMQSKRA